MINLCFKNLHLIGLNIERLIPKILPGSGAGNFSELRLTYKKSARADQRFSAIRTVGVLT